MTEDETWQVVIDHQGRHSVWPQDRSVPTGWTPAGFAGTRAACIAHIDMAWSDPLPAGWRQALDNRRQAASHG